MSVARATVVPILWFLLPYQLVTSLPEGVFCSENRNSQMSLTLPSLLIIVALMNESASTKKQPAEDWHPADIVCALRKAGWTLRKLSAHHGYVQHTTLSNALHRRWPKGQRLIAEAIGVPPETIWPNRYAQSTNGLENDNVKDREAD